MAKKSNLGKAPLVAGLTVMGLVFILKLASLFGVPLVFLGQVEQLSVDVRFRVRGPQAPYAPIVIAAIDDASLNEMGRWPWPRHYHAKLLESLSQLGARAVAFDIFFSEPEITGAQQTLQKVKEILPEISLGGSREDARKFRKKYASALETLNNWQIEEDHDQVFANSIISVQEMGMDVVLPIVFGRHHKKVVVPGDSFLPDAQPGGFPEDIFDMEGALISIPKIAQSAGAHGFIMPIFADSDGTFRSVPLYVRYQGRLVPNLGFQMARLATEAPLHDTVVVPGVEVSFAGRTVPVDVMGRMTINYRGGSQTFPHVSVKDIIQGNAEKSLFEGAIVLVGATSIGIYDVRPTPFSKIFPGVEIHANIIDNLLEGDFLRSVPNLVNLFLVLALSLAAILVCRSLSALPSAVIALALAIGYLVGSQILFNSGYVMDAVYPLMGFLGTFLAVFITKSRHESKEKEHIKDLFSKFVTRDVMNDIIDQPGEVPLGGQEKEITVLFSDIESFTTFSEAHPPAEVVSILNEYLTEMTDVIFHEQGTLDKYIGDAVMAIWGAPLHQDDQALRACRAGLGMLTSLKKLRTKWIAEGKDPFDMRVGINTGTMVVGVMGSQVRYDYTCIGDGVNLSARLEGTNKIYGSHIIISQSTRDKVKNELFNRELDWIRVKGKLEPVGIYEITGKEDVTSEWEGMCKSYGEGLALYRAKRFADAQEAFAKALGFVPEDKPSKVLMKRVQKFLDKPPAKDWDGVFVMETK